MVISLIQLHAEKIRPPRTLFVPFELGRPIGAPRDRVGQRDVVLQALGLLDHMGPEPILQTYPDVAPAVVDDVWQPFDVDGENTSLIDEFPLVYAAYERFVAAHGSTSFGNSGLPAQAVIETVSGLLQGELIDGKRLPSKVLRFVIDDLKSLYFEAACAGETSLSSVQLGTWFWRTTAAGRAIATLRAGYLQGDDKGRRKIAAFMVPGEWVDYLGLEV